MGDDDTYTIVLTGASGFLGQHCLKGFLDAAALNGGPFDKDDGHAKPSRVKHLIIHALHQSKPQLESAIQSYQAQTLPESKEGTTDVTSDQLTSVTVVTHALDLTSSDACQAWIATTFANSLRIDCCLHIAALSNPGVCEQEPEKAAKINVPTHFLDALLRHNQLICIIALSTDQVYNGNLNQNSAGSSSLSLYTEESVAEPVNVYGRTKLALEDFLLRRRAEAYPESTIILLRSSIILGPLAPFIAAHDTFLHFCHRQASSKSQTTYFTNEIRSVIAVSDVVTILTRLVGKACNTSRLSSNEASSNDGSNNAATILPSGVYCMGGPHAVSRHDMAVAVVQEHLQLAPLSDYVVAAKKEANGAPGAVQSPLDIGMDSSKLQNLLGLSPFQSLSDIVADMFPPSNC